MLGGSGKTEWRLIPRSVNLILLKKCLLWNRTIDCRTSKMSAFETRPQYAAFLNVPHKDI
jgi:hypothetical protein